MEINALISRTKNLILKPEEEWKVIESEDTKPGTVMMNFVLPYLVLDFIASLLGSYLFAWRWFFNPIRYAVATALTSFVVYIIVLYVTPIIIKALGYSFGTEVSQEKAFKLIAYSFVPLYLIAILTDLFPVISILSILGLYSLYILWHGFGSLLHAPEDKKVGFYIVSILIIIGEYIVLSLILGLLFTSLFVGSLLIL
ncbi:MAG: Yip1 family protein [Bacteroidales bacterium]